MLMLDRPCYKKAESLCFVVFFFCFLAGFLLLLICCCDLKERRKGRMGICYSSSNSSNKEREREWKAENDSNKFNRKLSKDGSNDFSSRISKFGGGGGGGGAVVAAEERALHQIPGRLFLNGSSRIACLHTQQGKKGTNQDAMIFWEDFCSLTDTVFCGVFDGHGPYGHMVARKVRDCLPLLLRKEWELISENDQNFDFRNLETEVFDDDCCESTEIECNERFPDIHLPLKMSILKAFKLMDKELKLHPTIDSFCSGSTAVTLIMKGQDLIIGNVGDSRAVLATKDKDNTLAAVQLTVDLKPNLPREAARIEKYKGRVFALQDEPEVARVWLPNSDSPGLAMARAFGDFCLKDFGLISVPDVYHHPITHKDEFVVLATDGIWDVLSNKEAVDVVVSAPSRATAARALIDSATRAWRLKYPTSKMDDCAVVCLFLDHPSSGDDLADSTKHGMMTTTISTSANVTDHVVGSQISLNNVRESGEIKPVVGGESKRSLAECISSGENDEWSALEGITRVNSLLSIPRFSSVEKRTGSWRKWM